MIHNKHIFKFLANAVLVFTFVTTTTQASFDFFKKLKEVTILAVDTNKANLAMRGPEPPIDR